MSQVMITHELAQPQLAAPRVDGQASAGSTAKVEGPCYGAKPCTFLDEETYQDPGGRIRRFCIDCGAPEPF